MAFKSTYQNKSVIESPEALFYDLRNRKVEGLLSHQADVLRIYSKEANKKTNVAMELPTGSGKTLIGLTIAEYRRRAFHERVVYLCPTKQLVHQVVDEARDKYGINTVAFTGSQKSYDPRAKAEYTNSEAVAVTTYSSLFNINPYFYNPNFIVLDDAHSAENYIAKHWSLLISRKGHKVIYNHLLEIFNNVLPFEQYQRMRSDNPSPNDKEWVEKIPTPYFYNKLEQLIPFLDEATKGKTDLEYNWAVLREHLSGCQIYFNWNSILIRPIIPPTSIHTPFASATQRLYMSATLGLGGELERITGQPDIHRIKAPEGWDKHGVGRRLFFFPGTSLTESDSEKLVSKLIEESSRTLILVPDDRSAGRLKERISTEPSNTIFGANDIELSKDVFTSTDKAVAILANRYDGINLAGDDCRLEIMQGLPAATNLHERFLESRMSAALLLKDRIRTRIVQAIGRCTRSATDYSAVCVMGDELQDRLLQRQNIQLYHPELQAELKFGYEESKGADGVNDFLEMYRTFLKQDSDEWRGADAQIVARREDSIQTPDPTMDILQKVVSEELKYQTAMWVGDYQRALEYANNVASQLTGDNLKGYRGFWYYLAGSAAWLVAQRDSSFYNISRARYSQAANCTLSVTWFKNLVSESAGLDPEIEENRHMSFLIERLENELNKMGTSSERKFNERVTNILTGLEDNSNGIKFEQAHEDLGRLIGYIVGNTEENAGPDPWWIAGDDFCMAAEDFTETDGTKPIPTYKIRQLNDHPTWISRKIEGLSTDTEFLRVIISPATKIERSAVTISREISYWNQSDFVIWANRAIQAIRELRLDYTGPGNETWRVKAMSVYREAGIDPESIKSMLLKNALSNLQQV
ncbi:DEAD/DEAH box helicase [Psychrobacillus psychrotolerans]|uniref:DEAD/DEAH box helicase n=1 Tax=Psychrobacillus psychrotolerans TaxID=126156 RepID=UPI0033152D8F